ncbi:M16 family metallopeptidase [Rhodococcus qingshengii]|uniref:M16 family metallopeptidase n=1 Tax=Rhodococcus qingshengii TaxID=334542 RepID=UPI00365C8696
MTEIDSLSMTLDSGLRIAIRQTKPTGLAGVCVSAGVGYRDDPSGAAGAVHLVEHLALEPLSDGCGHVRSVEQLGGRTGAETFEDITELHTLVPAQSLEVALHREFRRLSEPPIDTQSIARARRVVVAEIRAHLPLRPHRFFPWTVLPAAMYSDEAHGHNGYGDEHTLGAISEEVCTAVWRRGYRPESTVVAVVSDRPCSDVAALVAKAARDNGDKSPADLSTGKRAEPQRRPFDPHAVIAAGTVAAVGFELPRAEADWDVRKEMSALLGRRIAELGQDRGEGLHVRRGRFSYFESPPVAGPDVCWLTFDVAEKTTTGRLHEHSTALLDAVAAGTTDTLISWAAVSSKTAAALACTDPSVAARAVTRRVRLGAEPTPSDDGSVLSTTDARTIFAQAGAAPVGVVAMAAA